MATAWKNREMLRSRLTKTSLIGLMWITVIVVALPLVAALITSFKPDTETQLYPPTILPAHWTLINYSRLFQLIPYFQVWYWNTFVVATATAVITIVISASAAYSIARFRSRVAEAASFLGLAAYMVPEVLLIVPIFRIAIGVHALDSLPWLVCFYSVTFLPFAVWQLRSYFAGAPPELEEAAMVDGASRFEAFLLVVLPMAFPGLIAISIFVFSVVWSEYLFASLLLYTPLNQTLSIGLSPQLIGKSNLYSWGILMAACALMTVPVLIVFMFVQRRLVAGLDSGALRG